MKMNICFFKNYDNKMCLIILPIYFNPINKYLCLYQFYNNNYYINYFYK